MSSKFRRYRYRVTSRARTIILPCAALLLAVNIYYAWVVMTSPVDPNVRHVENLLNDIREQTRAEAVGWISTQYDSIYLAREWYGDFASRWGDKGVCLMLFSGDSLLYWSDYPLPVTDCDYWKNRTGTIRSAERDQVLTINYSQGERSAVVVVNLFNAVTNIYNPYLFHSNDQNLLPATDSVVAKSISALRVEAAGNAFYIEPLVPLHMPVTIQFCGWFGILMLGVWVKMFITRATTRGNVYWCLLVLIAILMGLRCLIGWAEIPYPTGELFRPIYGQHNYLLHSLGDTILNAGLVLLICIYLYGVRGKIIWRYKRFNRTHKILSGILIYGFIGTISAVFHYALILSIHTPHINIQIYDIFDLSYMTVMFYLFATMFVACAVLLGVVAGELFSQKTLIYRVGFCAAVVLAILWPLEDYISNTGPMMVLFLSTYLLTEFLRGHFRSYGTLVLTLLIFSSYITYFATIEDSTAQNNLQRLYARILTTSPEDRLLGMQIEDRRNSDVRFKNFTYAKISDGKIVFKHNNSNSYQGIASLLVDNRDTTIARDDQKHLVYHDPRNPLKIVVVSRRETTILDSTALFVYIFLSLFITCLLMLRMSGLPINFHLIGTRYTVHVRAVVMGVVLFSMSCVTVVIINHMMINVRRDMRQFVNNNMQYLSDRLNQLIRDYPMIDDYSITPQGMTTLRDWINFERNDSEYTLNVFAVDGSLMMSTQATPDLTWMNTEAYQYLHNMGRPYFTKVTESSGYTSAYMPIVVNGQTVCYLNMLYYTLNSRSVFLQHDLLADVLNLFLIILFAAFVISELFYHLLTNPFRRLGSAMRNISSMQKIETKDKSGSISDEVDMLVKQYNAMIDNLRESYVQLARSEREGAWREMARAVAHEIKNPLTPMRLKVQMLQRAMQEASCEELRPRIDSTLELLVEQIDLLSRIAGEFSDFARLGEGAPQRIDLAPLICGAAQLYSSYDNIEMHLNCSRVECDREYPNGLTYSDDGHLHIWISADADHLRRVFVNLFLNAVQAIGSRPDGLIEVAARIEKGRIYITITDNGGGIPVELQGRMFQPNFTTKSSGSGLGLAISHKIITLLGGNISFVTTPGAGTVFTVELPICQ